MKIKFFLTVIIAILNIILGIIVYKKNNKSKSNRFYRNLCFTGGIWALFMAALLIIKDAFVLEHFIIKGIYFFAILPPLYYLLFSFYYPYNLETSQKKLQILIYAIPSVMAIFVLLGVLKMETFQLVHNQIYQTVVYPDYFILSLYFFGYIIWGFIRLLNKLNKDSGSYKNQISYLIIATFTTFVFTGSVSIILPLAGTFAYDWLGPIFLLIHFLTVGYLIFIKTSKAN